MFCTECGYKNNEGCYFCSNCETNMSMAKKTIESNLFSRDYYHSQLNFQKESLDMQKNNSI